MTILKRIQELQKLRGWSNYRLAKVAGISEGSLNNMFRLKNLPTIPTLESLCKAFDITLSQFFAESSGEPVTLTPEQADMLKLWDKLSHEQKLAMLELLRTI